MSPSIRVVIADDDASERTRMVKALGNQPGIEVVGQAGNGREALQLSSRLRPEVIVCSMIMPQLDGFGMLQQMQQQPQDGAKVILYSPLKRDDLVSRAFRLGAAHYMVKPMDGLSLASAIRTVQEQPGGIPPEHTQRALVGLLQQMNIPPHVSGYRYIRQAVELTLAHPEAVLNVTQLLYPLVAARENSSAARVERAIRHAIRVAWDRGLSGALLRRLPLSGSERPTNAELIAVLAEHLRYGSVRLMN